MTHRDTLLLIEDAEFRLVLAQAEAGCQNALVGESVAGAGLATTDNSILVPRSVIEEVKIQLANAETDYRRYKNLLEKGAVARQPFEGVKTQYEGLKAKVATMERQIATTRSARSEQELRRRQSRVGIDVASAALNLARLNLSYTVITAPCDGVTSAKTIQEGELLTPGQRLLSIVSDARPWVIANFRESQLGGVAVGNKVDIKVDAFGMDARALYLPLILCGFGRVGVFIVLTVYAQAKANFQYYFQILCLLGFVRTWNWPSGNSMATASSSVRGCWP